MPRVKLNFKKPKSKKPKSKKPKSKKYKSKKIQIKHKNKGSKKKQKVKQRNRTARLYGQGNAKKRRKPSNLRPLGKPGSSVPMTARIKKIESLSKITNQNQNNMNRLARIMSKQNGDFANDAKNYLFRRKLNI